ncbi:MAG: hypothetical protein J6X62_07800 [Bacteroidales bacterium]|nr:hypothetical protein [Bacteroidales bacterium]
MQHKDNGGNAVYEAPILTVVEFRVESGYATSIADGIAVNGNEMVELITDEGGSEFDDGDFF